MKTAVMIFLILTVSSGSSAQHVVATAGNVFSIEGYKVEWSLGEPVISSFRDANILLTQGLHQPLIVSTGVDDPGLGGVQIRVFPNPVRRILHLEVSHQEGMSFHCRIFDLTGRELLNMALVSDKEAIDFERFVPGVYFLTVFSSGNQSARTLKVIKR